MMTRVSSMAAGLRGGSVSNNRNYPSPTPLSHCHPKGISNLAPVRAAAATSRKWPATPKRRLPLPFRLDNQKVIQYSLVSTSITVRYDGGDMKNLCAIHQTV